MLLPGNKGVLLRTPLFQVFSLGRQKFHWHDGKYSALRIPDTHQADLGLIHYVVDLLSLQFFGLLQRSIHVSDMKVHVAVRRDRSQFRLDLQHASKMPFPLHSAFRYIPAKSVVASTF